jgi:hypothetical protein
MHRDLARRRTPLLILLALALLVPAAGAHAQISIPSLLFTAIAPCRLIDTRVMGGPLAAGATRTFNVVGVSAAGSLASQGGNPNGCPIPGFVNGFAQVQSVAINLIAVNPAGPGDLIAWPTDESQPTASVINYINLPSGVLNIANMVILPVRQDFPVGADITVKAQVSGVSLVADVLGYYSDATPTAGAANLFVGTSTGSGPPTGMANSSFGSFSLLSLTAGNGNSALGTSAMFKTQGGNDNTAVGQSALSNNVAGTGSTAIGWNALLNATGGGNIALGSGAGKNITAGSGNIDIGNAAPGDESNTIRIGDTATQTAAFMAGVNGATSASGTAVFVNAGGQLGTTTSSLRFKEDVQDMEEASGGLMNLRPVTFRYAPRYDDGSRLLQYGLIAEEVAQVYPGLVQLDAGGKPLAVRYHFINAMLLNEVQKQHRTIEDQRARLAELEAQVAAQRRQAEQQEARLRRLEDLLAPQPAGHGADGADSAP